MSSLVFSAGLCSIRMEPLPNRTSLWEVDSLLVLSQPLAALGTVTMLLGAVDVNEGLRDMLALVSAEGKHKGQTIHESLGSLLKSFGPAGWHGWTACWEPLHYFIVCTHSFSFYVVGDDLELPVSSF